MSAFQGRYVFVAGLHRSGTSLLARLMGQHAEISSIENSPAPENEGCYLQGAIPHTAQHGIPGHYATDPAQHLIEGSAYDTLATRERMEADWDQWFTRDGQWRVEKSPVNLTRMRLYQQLFPMAQFVVILRHPQIVAAAMRKWVDQPHDKLIDYVLDSYDIALRDAQFLHAVLVVRYEDIVRGDDLQTVFRFLGLTPITPDVDLRDGNADYPSPPPMTAEQSVRCGALGYLPQGKTGLFMPIVRHPLREVRDSCGGGFGS